MKILLIFTVITFLAVQTMVLAAEDPVLRYTFDANTVQGNTVKDISGNGVDGTINGGAESVGGAMAFDGKDGYIVTPALDARIAGKAPFTAICWFKTDLVANGPLWMWGDNSKPSSSSGAEGPVGWMSSTKKFAAGFYNNAHFYAEAKEDYADNRLHVAAQVGDEAKGYLYVDGEFISETTAGYIYAVNPYLLIGARTKNSGSLLDDVEYFKGTIDQIILYDFAMTKEEIKLLSSKGNAVSSSGKLGTLWGQIKDGNR